MRVWHSPWSWLKLIVAAESVAGNTRTGMLTRLIFMNPFHVGLAAIAFLSLIEHRDRTDYRRFKAPGSGVRTQGCKSVQRSKPHELGTLSHEPPEPPEP